jgi:hypothetical protein
MPFCYTYGCTCSRRRVDRGTPRDKVRAQRVTYQRARLETAIRDLGSTVAITAALTHGPEWGWDPIVVDGQAAKVRVHDGCVFLRTAAGAHEIPFPKRCRNAARFIRDLVVKQRAIAEENQRHREEYDRRQRSKWEAEQAKEAKQKADRAATQATFDALLGDRCAPGSIWGSARFCADYGGTPTASLSFERLTPEQARALLDRAVEIGILYRVPAPKGRT